jgi:hypothetical protein
MYLRMQIYRVRMMEKSKRTKLATFSNDSAKGVVAYDLDLVGGEFLPELVVGIGELSLMVLGGGRGVFVTLIVRHGSIYNKGMAQAQAP